ncbi:MAG: putative lipid II flippase FtsW [Firmicutes bacterium]|nr:putative lipid II flippase FtsW [Bacillota bacterium]
MRSKKSKLKSGDFILVILTVGLVIFGIIMVFSASYYQSINETSKSGGGNPYGYLTKDVMWAVLGFGLMLFTAVFDYRRYRKFAIPILIASFILLVLLMVPGIGHEGKGATRWIGVGSITIMPGEIAKIALIIFVAWFLSEKPQRIKSLTRGILPLFGICAVFGGLILIQPNMSTAITVVAIVILMMFVAGLSWLYCGGLVGLGAVGIAAIIITNPDSHWAKRITSFTDPFADPLGDGFQVVQSLMALGSGGLFGVGLGKSIQKNLYLPEPQNDFILAIIGEELGFVGILVLMTAYVILIWRGIHIAVNAPDQFGTLMASGITIMVAIQVILNVAVVTSSMPPTGITLPFVSYGGNALMLFMGSMGILLNISRHTAQVK